MRTMYADEVAELFADGPFVDGYDAYDMGVPVCQNPYAAGVEYHDLWRDGWLQAEGDFGG